MQTTPEITAITPPRLVASITAGFNVVANHVYIIIFPVLLDVLLWIGPHLRVKTLMEPVLSNLFTQLNAMNNPDLAAMSGPAQSMWEEILTRFNLVSLLRTYPVGIFSLFTGTQPMVTPWGKAPLVEVPTAGNVLLYWLTFTLLGLFFGSMFFSEVARCSAKPDTARPHTALWLYMQTVLLVVSFFIILIAISIPVSIVVTILAVISPFAAQIAVFVIAIFLLWLLLPMVFSPHGIYTTQQNALLSMLTSVRLVRFYLPGTGFFILIILLLGQGLNVIWRVPPPDSWMAAIGIAGHAFVTTALLAASFIYYQGGLAWMQENLKKIIQPGAKV